MIRFFRRGDDVSAVTGRSQLDFDSVNSAVESIVKDVRERGDKALCEYAEKFDGGAPRNLKVTEEEVKQAFSEVPEKLVSALGRARENILSYHRKQLVMSYEAAENGRSTGWLIRPVQRAGIYVPGGTAAYPSSVLMTALPAAAAGVSEIVMTTPAKNGKIHPLTIVAAVACGVKEIYKTGGAQAIAALAFGTETVKRADVIAGPGNIFVTVAKKQVYGYVGIDMIAGPSEILIIADGTAKPEFVAADMLSQAEHDPLSAAILVTPDERLAKKTEKELEKQLKKLPRASIAEKALSTNSAIIVTEDIDSAFDIANAVAPEHLELCIGDARSYLDKVENAGAVFIGNYSPEPLGDYFAGPNHVLPTSGTSRYFSVLNTLTFMKRTSVIEYDRDSLLKCADDVISLAESEGLTAHANSIRIRGAKSR